MMGLPPTVFSGPHAVALAALLRTAQRNREAAAEAVARGEYDEEAEQMGTTPARVLAAVVLNNDWRPLQNLTKYNLETP